MEDLVIARALHVLAIVHWIGGLAFVTLVALPAIGAVADASRRFDLFAALERRFAAQVRVSVPLAGLSGLYMAWKLDAWQRFLDPAAWWLAAMALLWAVFMIVLFVVEPLGARHAEAWAVRHAERSFLFLQRMHRLLLAVGAVVTGAAVLGAHGLLA